MKRFLSEKVRPVILSTCVAAFSASLAVEAFAAFGPDKDWPCAQRKRENLSLGAIWNGPESSETDKAWQGDEKVVTLVKALSKRRTSVEDGKKLIDDFATKIDGDKSKSLTAVFTGLFQTLNLERRNIVKGIEKYAIKQRELSEEVKKVALEVDALDNKDELTDEEAKKLDSLNEKLNWETRIYDERNQSLEFVCESPVLIEQRLFAFAKHIEGKLK